MIFPLLYSQKFIITQYSHIGILSYLGLLTTFLGQIFVVNSAHKIEYKHILLLSLTGIAISLWILTQSTTFLMLLCLYLILRSFMSFYHPLGITMVSRTHPDQGLDFAMGIQNGSGNLGVFFAFISVGYIAQRYGWEMSLHVWALIALSAGIIGFMAVRSTSSLHRDMTKPNLQVWIRTAKDLKKLIPGFVYGGACWATTVYYAPSFLNHKLLIPLGQTGVYMGAWIALGTIMPYLFGWLCRKIGRLNISLLGLGGSTVLVFLLGMSKQIPWAVMALLVYGLFLFLIYPAFQSYVSMQTPSSNQAVAFSLAANVTILTGATVNLFAGFLADKFGINSPFLFLAILGCFTTFFYLINKAALQDNRSY